MSYDPLINLNGNNITQGKRITLSGSVALVLGSAIVNTTKATSTCVIHLSRQSGTLNIGDVSVSAKVNGVSFTITSANPLDATTIAYTILEIE